MDTERTMVAEKDAEYTSVLTSEAQGVQKRYSTMQSIAYYASIHR